MRKVRIGISTCPNDTFLFHALLEGHVRPSGIGLEFELLDVEELNERMLAGCFELAKTSFHAMLALGQRVWLLPSGAALGFGVGPLLLAAPGRGARPPGPQTRVLTPGRWTTACLLYRLLFPAPARLEHLRFSEILPALAAGRADLGVCIHEARFTWREHGVEWVADLGSLWEERTGAAVPLGGLCVRRDLGRDLARELARAVRASLDWALAHREACLPTMRRHAQEQEERVLWAHVDLYVNAWTRELGPTGREALRTLGRLAGEHGLASGELEPLEA